MTRHDVVEIILAGRPSEPGQRGEAFAPSNIALCKYWGKRDEELNLPMNPSLSVSLGTLGTRTALETAAHRDVVVLNDRELDPLSPFALRISEFLDLFRPDVGFHFLVQTWNTIPASAGVASSASGFAALVKALDEFFGWSLTRRELSILARLGSGSACRSVASGFVEWHAGRRSDGLDSYARALRGRWPRLRLGLLLLSTKGKEVGSREGMRRTVRTSELYQVWPKKARRDLRVLKEAIRDRDFVRFGEAAESNAFSMHATMLGAWPPLVYFSEATVGVFRKVWALRREGLPVYLTIDAGPNPVLLFEEQHIPALHQAFPELKIVAPFRQDPAPEDRP